MWGSLLVERENRHVMCEIKCSHINYLCMKYIGYKHNICHIVWNKRTLYSYDCPSSLHHHHYWMNLVGNHVPSWSRHWVDNGWVDLLVDIVLITIERILVLPLCWCVSINMYDVPVYSCLCRCDVQDILSGWLRECYKRWRYLTRLNWNSNVQR